MEIIVRKPTEEEIKEAESWGDWAKEPSEFPWSYDQQETCYVLSGKATVTAGEEEVSFGAGDWVIFPKGLECTWKIEEAIRKKYRFG